MNTDDGCSEPPAFPPSKRPENTPDPGAYSWAYFRADWRAISGRPAIDCGAMPVTVRGADWTLAPDVSGSSPLGRPTIPAPCGAACPAGGSLPLAGSTLSVASRTVYVFREFVRSITSARR